MATMNFTDYSKQPGTGSANTERVKIGYFGSLKEDGDETLVRLNYSTQEDFKVTTVHRVKDGDKWKDVACLKENFYDSEDKCPLCKASSSNENLKMRAKVYVMLLEYSKDETGKVVASPKVWTRGVGFIPAVMDAIADAIEDEKITKGTKIRDVVLKIKRSGAKGSLDTAYKIKVMNPAVCPDSQFSADFSAFKNFDAARFCYWNKTAEEMKNYLATGSFPEVVKEGTTATVSEATESLPTHPGVEAELPFEEPAPEVAEEKPTIRRYGW